MQTHFYLPIRYNLTKSKLTNQNSKYLSTVRAATVRKIAPTVALQEGAWIKILKTSYLTRSDKSRDDLRRSCPRRYERILSRRRYQILVKP